MTHFKGVNLFRVTLISVRRSVQAGSRERILLTLVIYQTGKRHLLLGRIKYNTERFPLSVQT